MHKGFLATLVMITAGALLMTDPGSVVHDGGPTRIMAVVRHRRQRFRIGHTVYIINHQKPAYEHLSEYQIQLCLHQLKAQTLHDVKMERADDLSTSIESSRKLDRLAALRASQVARRFSHYGRDHKPMTTIDARKAGLPHGFQASENIASASLGNCTVFGDPKIYHNRNGRDMANMSNDGMMHYDALENNGHRKNILNSDSSLIGVGVAYSRHKHKFYLVEDFGDLNPRSSADVSRKSLKLDRIHLKNSRQLTTVQKFFRRVVRWSGIHFINGFRWLHDRISQLNSFF